MKLSSQLAILVFCLVALAHFLRLVFQVEILIGGETVPLWASVIGVVVPGALAVGLWREADGR
jgi:hypothetical protein